MRPVNLTAHHRKLLGNYRSYHTTAPTFGSLVRQHAAALAVLAGITAGGAYLAFHTWGWLFGLGCFAGGLGFGSLIRILRPLASFARLWPIIDHIVDWQKVDTLLDQETSR
jgi:hypothetical protein